MTNRNEKVILKLLEAIEQLQLLIIEDLQTMCSLMLAEKRRRLEWIERGAGLLDGASP